MQYSRALEMYAVRKSSGAGTRAAMRGTRAPGSCRGDGGRYNRRKAVGLGFALVQWFVDHCQRLLCRSDSCLLLSKARSMRETLAAETNPDGSRKWPDADLPKLIGNAGHTWFLRWRRMYGIVRKVTGMKLQVPWSKVRRRIRCLLGNIYRLRAFWELCHPGTEMRWISLDQKPSWFNNAGHTGTFAKKGGSQPNVREDFNGTRERYSILTSVPSWGHEIPNNPPKYCLLFKAKPNGTVIKELRQSNRLKPWVMVQVQENGSYRSSDMVEALEWILPGANDSSESIVVMLDWYSGHLTQEVADLVRSKGHVLLFHGGGCTPFSQINDTHLHSQLARLLIEIENLWGQAVRQENKALGINKTPRLDRETIMSIVEQAWEAINHKRVAEKGYRQTGPTLPLRGPIAPEDIYKDLLRVIEELEPSTTALEVGMTLRDEAVAFVREGWETGKWTQWSDCYKLIEEQDGAGEALEEGLEASYQDATQNGDEDEDDEDAGAPGDEQGDEDDDGAGGGSGGLSAKHGATHDVSDGIDSDHMVIEDSDDEPTEVVASIALSDSGAAVSGGASGDGSASAAAPLELITLVAARQVLYEDAVRKKDDLLMRQMRKQMRTESQNTKDASTEIAVLLRKRSQESMEEDTKRYKEAEQAKRLAAKDIEVLKNNTEKTRLATEQVRLLALKQTVLNRQDAAARKHQEATQRAYQRWLQTQYPAQVARDSIKFWNHFSGKAQRCMKDLMMRLLKEGTFNRPVFIPPLWEEDKTFTAHWATIGPLFGGAPRSVRCGFLFQEVCEMALPSKHSAPFDPVNTLIQLWRRAVPIAEKIFVGNYTPLRLLHQNGYSMEKAYLHGMSALSKWLTKKHFEQGLYGNWPPLGPSGLVAVHASSIHPVDVDALGAASSSAGNGDSSEAHLPPGLRIGKPASGSAAPSKP